MSMIKSNYQIDGPDLHPISNLLIETAAPKHQHHAHHHHAANGPLVNSLAPILVATNMPGVNPNVISNG